MNEAKRAVPVPTGDFALWPIDGGNGKIMGDFAVSQIGGMLVFKYEGIRFDEQVEINNPDEFLKLANLVCPSKIRRQGEMPEGFLADNGIRTTATLPGDISYDVDFSCIVELARTTGPLFGIPKEKTKEAIIKEPIEAWVSAAKVLNFAIRAESLLSDQNPKPQVLDGDLLYQEIIYRNGLVEKVLTKSFDSCTPEPYCEMFRLNDEERRAFSMATNFGEGAEYVQPLLEMEEAFSDITPYIGVSLASGPPSGRTFQSVICPSSKVWEFDPDCSETKMNTLQSLVESLLQYLIRLHVMHVRLGWRPVFDKGRDYSTLDLSFNNHLEYLWHQFAARHSLGRLGVCEHCGGLFSSINQRRALKRFCSPECQSRAKSKRQRERKANEQKPHKK